MLDVILAVAHHLLVFGMAALLAAELTALRSPAPDARRLAGLDAGYGVVALLVIGVGAARLAWGGKGWAFYEANPFFWAKIAVFAAIGLLSAVPTLRFLAWRRATRADPGFTPPLAEVTGVIRIVRLELMLIAPLVALAAVMARWPF